MTHATGVRWYAEGLSHNTNANALSAADMAQAAMAWMGKTFVKMGKRDASGARYGGKG